MIVNAYDNNDNLVFDTEFDIESPISNLLIEKGLKQAPNNYYDNSFEGLKVRLNTKTSNNDIEIFNNNFSLDNELYKLLYDLETKDSVSISIDLFKEFCDSKTSFLRNLYDNICDEFKNSIDDVETLIIKL